jgi:serine/threonine protein kinase
MDYCSYGSLKNLIDSVGSLPEFMIRSITNNILKGLNGYNKNTYMAYSGICSNNILFDSDLNIKVVTYLQ